MIGRLSLGLSTLLLTGLAWGVLHFHDGSVAQEQQPKTADLQLGKPFQHDNLTICLIRGPDRLKGHKFIMLAEALERKKFVIYETQKVNDLAMENLSDEEVVILSGDILKGGQQDRIAQYDQVVPPRSGKVPLAVFCVEHTASRWMQPLTDKDKTFSASPGQICTNDLRLANRGTGRQTEVWENVMKAQDKLSANAKVEVRAKESDSSLALSLKASQVEKAVDKYVAKLAGIVGGEKDAVGYVFAINGKVVSADVYGSPAIFRKVWPRLLRASALEAFADRPEKGKFPAVKSAAFRTFLEEASKGKLSRAEDAKGLRQTTNEKARILRSDSKKEAAPLRSQSIRY
jgi:hypothetical protein